MDYSDFSKKIQHVNERIAEFQKLQDDILSADLIPVIEELKSIDGNQSVSCTNRVSSSLADLSSIGLEKSKRLQRGYLKPSPHNVWSSLLQVYHLTNRETFDWKRFGEETMDYFSNVGTVDFLNGCLYKSPEDKSNKDQEVPPKKQRKRLRNTISQQSSPVEVTQITERNELRKTTIEVTKRIKRTLAESGKDEVEMVPILNDSQMFSKTVENFFAVSFLVANGRLGIDESEEGPLTLRMTRPSEDLAHSTVINQGILSLNPAKMHQLLKEAKLDKDLDPSWSKQ